MNIFPDLIATNNAWTGKAKRSDAIEIITDCPGRPYVELKVPQNVSRIDRLRFVTISHDQGYSGTQDTLGGTYEQSYTWFDAVAISPANHERIPPKRVQTNINASFEPRKHENVWDRHSTDVDIRQWISCIRGGDTIQIIPRAEFPAWTNFIQEAEIEASGPLEADISPASAVLENRWSGYSTLEQSRREIRVLVIEPGQYDDPISCSMESIYLDDEDHVKYEALSYCWGNIDDTATIMLQTFMNNTEETSHQQELAVTSMLYTALKHLRYKDSTSRTLWVDALCINQNDLHERSHQVSLMTYVYSQASRVHIWLGPGNDLVKECFRTIRTIATRYADMNDPATSSHAKDDISRLHDPMMYHELIPFMEKWRRCNFAWFRRTWVLQEVANAKDAVVQCGEDTLPWPVIMRLADCIIKAKRATSLFRPAIMPSVFFSVFNFDDSKPAAVERSVRQGILEILIGAHELDATDPKDKIFALLQFGVETQDVERLPVEIRPDYRKSVAEVYADFTRWWILTHKSLRILSAVHTTKDRGWQQMSIGGPVGLSELDHPTWSFWHGGVASWAKGTLALALDTPYSATGTTEPDLRLLREFADPFILCLSGHRLGVISEIRRYPFYARNTRPELDEVFTRIFDPVGQWKTWAWNRDDQEYLADRNEDVNLQQHFITHGQFIMDNEGAFPCFSPCFFRSGEGGNMKMGLCPHNATVGDEIVLLYGGKVPYLLRDKERQHDEEEAKTKRYEFLGECFLLGFMEGEALREFEGNGTQEDQFELI